LFNPKGISMSVSELLFELASDERVAMLTEMESQPLRQSDVARKLSLTVQEASRQLERLTDAKLVSKDSESRYRVTPFGRIVLAILPSFSFVQQQRDFLLAHDLSSLPETFVHRLGELSNHRSISKLDEAMAHLEQVVTGSSKYVWIMADQNVRQAYPHEHSAGVPFKLILPKGVDSETVQTLRTRIGNNLQIARMAEVELTIAMNEKTAAVYFQNRDGQMDFMRGFASEESTFHRWCEDIFCFFWSQAYAGAASSAP
jgi:predicted transcriptional regulator